MKHHRIVHIALALLAVLLTASCANTRRVLNDGERLLYRNSYDLRMDNDSVATPEVRAALTDVDRYVRQQPRNGFFGFYHSIFNTYYWVAPTDSSWWARTMRNLGTAPVIYKPALSEASAQQIEALLSRRGCFHSTVSVDTVHLKHNRLATTYHIHASPRFKIDEIDYATADSVVIRMAERIQQMSPLQEATYYDQSNLDAHRDMIVNSLQRAGYYRASPDLIRFLIDTINYRTHHLGIEIVVDSPRIASPQQTPHAVPYQRYYLNSITIDSNRVGHTILRRQLSLAPGQPYNPQRTTSTYNALLELRNFSLINIEYREAANSSDDNRLLDAHIRLLNNSQQRISGSFELSNASPISREASNSGNFGSELLLQYQHRNLFGGAEQLTIDGNFLVELNKSVFTEGFSGFRNSFASFETGLGVSLDMPRFLFPYGNSIMFGNARPHTLLNTNLDYQYRSYFEREQVSLSFGYTWNTSSQIRHRLLPAEISYVQMQMSDDFATRIFAQLNNRLIYQYSDHLIIDANYNYLYSNQRIGRQTDFTYFNATLETAGNLAALLATSPFMRQRDDYGHYCIADVAYSQYVRASAEYKHYFYHGNNSSFVLRSIVGIGIPYGNSRSMPYEKSFYAGGPNNMRAWQMRYLGPGHYNSHDNGTSTFDQIGDLTFVLNLEERFPVIGIFEGAVFADIGNVWLMHKDEFMPGAEFQFKNIITDLALGIGIGLRVKVSFITLRLDIALPTYDPTYSTSERWRISHWRFNTINTNF